MLIKYFRFFIVTIIALSLGLSYFSGSQDVITVDELPHLGAGYSYWRTGKIYLNPEHPPLAKLVATFPIALMSNDDSAFGASYWHEKDPHYVQYEFARQFLYGSSINNPDNLTQLARLAMLLFPLIALIVVSRWSFEIGGPYASLTATILIGFSSTFLAHAKLITTDVPVASMIILALYSLKLLFEHSSSFKYSVFAGFALGLALLTKFSAVFLVPVYVLIFIFLSNRKNYRTNLVNLIKIFAIAYLMIFICYFIFDYNTASVEFRNYVFKILSGHQNDFLNVLSSSFALILLSQSVISYILGFIQVFDHNKNGHVAYFLGEISSKGSIPYFPIVFFIKETVGHIAIILAGLLLAVKNYKKQLLPRNDAIILLFWLLAYLGFSLLSDINIGIRHLLPIYPVIAIIVGCVLGQLIIKKSDSVKYFALLATGAIFASVLYAYPFYIPYFNFLAGGSENGYKIVADSNVDWGQDLKRLAGFVRAQNISKIELSYFSGWSDPNYYLGDKFIWMTDEKYKNKEDFIKNNSSDGWLAISVQFLQTNPNFAWLKNETPVAKIGYSIFVYRF